MITPTSQQIAPSVRSCSSATGIYDDWILTSCHAVFISYSNSDLICVVDVTFFRLYYKIFRKEYSSAGEDDHIHDGLLKPLQDQEHSITVSGGPHHTPEFNDCCPETSMEAVEELVADKTLEGQFKGALRNFLATFLTFRCSNEKPRVNICIC